MRLELSHTDDAPLQRLTHVLQPLGITLATLAQEQATNPEAVAQAYCCHNQCRKQQPPVELRQEPIAFDRWRTTFLDGENALPDAYFLAIHKQHYIGVCCFVKEADPDLLVNGFTGVLPDWNGQGIAKALKAHGLLWAKQHGFKTIETQNLLINRGMCAINRALGFQTIRKHLHTYPIPVVA